MTKRISYVCQNCSANFSKWHGQCSMCLSWNTLTEKIDQNRSNNSINNTVCTKKLHELSLNPNVRISSIFKEFDRVFGGGIVVGSVSLVGGAPGIGKSSILLQTLANLSKKFKTLYITGEESLEQIGLRAHRMGVHNTQLDLMNQTDIAIICSYLEDNKPDFVVIDSIQTMKLSECQSFVGSIAQVRETALVLTSVAKKLNISIFLIGHITKHGDVAGPKVLEHIVDTIVFMEQHNDSRYRIIRTTKNRFGPVNELGFFIMTEKGMKEVKTPSAIFLNQSDNNVSGTTVISLWEGSRPVLVEIQALVSKVASSHPKRLSIGIDSSRLSVLLALIQKNFNINLSDQDVFINVVGGIKINETSTDLSIVAIILSSIYDKHIPKDYIIIGEIGLSGEVRPVSYGQERLIEAEKHGFKSAILPTANAPKKALKIKYFCISNIKELKNILF